jgi:hypothetical protein
LERLASIDGRYGLGVILDDECDRDDGIRSTRPIVAEPRMDGECASPVLDRTPR